MSESEPDVGGLKKRLLGLVKCVIEQAESDPAFAARLEDILLGVTARSVPRRKGRMEKGISFIPVSVLKESGEDGLMAELGRKTDDELRLIVRSEGISQGKALKGLDRASMISRIADKAGNDLKRGTKVAGIGTGHRTENLLAHNPTERNPPEARTSDVGDTEAPKVGTEQAVGDPESPAAE